MNVKPISECRTLQELFVVPSRWTQHTSARDARGNRTSLNNPHASCFCLYGGLTLLYGIGEKAKAVEYLIEAEHRDFVGYNDAHDTTHSDILKLVTDLNI